MGRSATCDFLFVIHTYYVLCPYHFRNKHQYWPQILIFPTLYFKSPLRGSRWNFTMEWGSKIFLQCFDTVGWVTGRASGQ